MATVTTLGFSIRSSYDGSGTRAATRSLIQVRTTADLVNNSMNKASSGMGLVTTAAAAMAPALMPIAQVATGVGAATVAMAVSSGTALGAYGAAMAGAIKRTNEMAEAGKKLDPSQKKFIQSTKGMESAWNKFIISTQSMTLGTAASAIQGVTIGIGKLLPLVNATHPVIKNVADSFRDWAERGNGLQRFIDVVIKYGVPSLTSLVTAGKNVLSVLGTGFRAFAPLGESVANALARGSAAMKAWADGGGFTRFIERVRQNAPAVQEFFRQFWAAMQNIGVAMRGLGPLSLGLTTALLKIVAALPPSWIQAIVVGFVAWRTAMMGLLVIRTLVSIFMALRTALLAVQGAWMILNLAFAGSPIGLILIAVIALVGGIVYLATQTRFFQTVWNAVWGAIKVAFSATVNALQTAWRATVNGILTAWNAVGNALRAAWTAVWNALRTAGQAVWNAIRAAWNAVITAIRTVTTTYMAAVRVAWTAAWNAIRVAGQAVWNAIRAAWNAVITAIRTVTSTAMTAVRTAWTTAWNAIRTAGQAVWNALRAAWTATINAIRSVMQSVMNAIRAAWQAVWNAIRAAAQAVWNAMRAAWQAFVNGVRAIYNAWSSALRAAWQAFWNAIRTAAVAVWNAIKSLWQAFVNWIRNVFNTWSNALKTAWNNFWNAVKNTANTIWNSIKDLWSKFTNAIRDKANSFISGIKKALSDCWNAIKSTAQKAWSGIGNVIEKAINAVIGIINGLGKGFNAITSFLGLKDIKVGTIDPVKLNFATGGVVPVAVSPFAVGGIAGIQHFAGGGVLGGYSPGRDTVPAMLSPGEGILTPEAVRGLGGPGFVHSANREFAGHRGAGKGALPLNRWTGTHEGPQSRGIFALGGMVPVQHFAVGGLVSAALARAGGGFSITQGEYSNSVAASAGTHSGGGVIDIAAGPGDGPAKVARLRAAGFAAWLRTPSEGFAYHIHAVLMNHPDLSPQARSQVASYLAGGNGLANGGPDTGGGGFDVLGLIKDHVGKILGNVYKGVSALAGIGGNIASFFNLDGSKDDKENGKGFLGTGIGPDVGPDLTPGKDLGDAAGKVIGAATGTGSMLGMLGQMVLSLLDKTNIAEGFGDPIGKFKDFIKGGLGGKFADIAGGFGMKLVDEVIPKKLLDEKEKAGPMTFMMGGGGNVQMWSGLAAQALARAGLSAGQLGAFLALMQAESGGNPGAINLYDSNAAMGQASRGLMQVIPSTFAAYRDKSLPNNIMDPLANMTAAANYIKARYGGKVPGSPYALGTNNAQRGWHLVGENGPEMRYFRGGERVANARKTYGELSRRGGDGGCVFEKGAFQIDARGASVEAVREMETNLVPKLRLAVQAGVGKRG